MDKTVINFRLSELRKAKHITQGEYLLCINAEISAGEGSAIRSSSR